MEPTAPLCLRNSWKVGWGVARPRDGRCGANGVGFVSGARIHAVRRKETSQSTFARSQRREARATHEMTLYTQTTHTRVAEGFA